MLCVWYIRRSCRTHLPIKLVIHQKFHHMSHPNALSYVLANLVSYARHTYIYIYNLYIHTHDLHNTCTYIHMYLEDECPVCWSCTARSLCYSCRNHLHSLKEHIRAKSWILCWGWYWPHSTTLNTIQSLGNCATQPENVKL